MNQHPSYGISRQGLDVAFEADEAQKSRVIVTAHLLREQHRQDEAAVKFAEAARIEERLSKVCEAKGLTEKAVIHRFSAASCWAQAGNFYQAIAICDELLARADLLAHFRQRIQDYVQILRVRRAQWYEELVLETTELEG